jgi:hypothetical protein
MVFPLMACKQRSNSTKETVAAALISQGAFAREHGWSPQYVNKLVKEGKITLVDGKIDPAAADAELVANGVGQLRPRDEGGSQDADEGVRLEWEMAPADSWQAAIDIILQKLQYRCGACGFFSRLDDMTPGECCSILRDVLQRALAELEELNA